MRGYSVSVSLSFHKVCNGNQLLMICFPRINNLLKDIDESYVTVQVYHYQYEDIVRSNLALHRSDTPFIIRQPIRRPCLLERVYKPICTPHWCRDLQSLL